MALNALTSFTGLNRVVSLSGLHRRRTAILCSHVDNGGEELAAASGLDRGCAAASLIVVAFLIHSPNAQLYPEQ